MSETTTQRPQEPDWDECVALLERLPSLPTDERIAAIERLVRNPSPLIRERALRTGAAVVADERLEAYLREDADEVLRNAGLEMVKMRGARALPLAIRLLKDPDSDIALQAVLALGHIGDLRALEPLRGSLAYDDPNVVQAAIEAVGKLGDARAIPDLLPFLDADPWLQMAAVQALGDLRSPAAVPHLAPLLTDLLVGPLAAEALARIGGTRAFRLLAHHWLAFREELDPETSLGLLAHVLEGLPRPPKVEGELLARLEARLADDETRIREVAARCLLASRSTDWDAEALDVLAASEADAAVLPACLSHRQDLAAELLHRAGKARSWGFLLAARYPKEAPVESLAAALTAEVPPEQLQTSVRKALEKLSRPELAAALLHLYQAAPEDLRPAVTLLLTTQRRELRDLLGRWSGLSQDDRLVLAARLGFGTEELVAELLGRRGDRRLALLERVTELEEVVRRLPWKEWLAEDPARLGPLAARAAADFDLRELLPELRRMLAASPRPELVRALGELGDRDSVPALVELVGANRLQPLVLESLGRIGGPWARQALRSALADGGCDERIAYRALSLCAIEEDDAVFRRAAGHPDWYVRLACAEVLGRFLRPENLAALSQLASDSVPIVAQRALSALES